MDMTMNGAHKEQVQSLQEEIEELKMRYAEQITKNTK